MNELQDNTSYKSWTDTHNVIKEYYKLKQMLCLTEAEREKLGISEWSDYVRYKPNQ